MGAVPRHWDVFKAPQHSEYEWSRCCLSQGWGGGSGRWISDVCQEGGVVAFTEQAFAKDEGLTRDVAAAELGLGARSSDPHPQSPAFIQG